MQKTPLGLTRLAPGEPLSVDNFSFQDLNPKIIDALLQYAAFRHRHDGHAPLGAPVDPPTASVADTGGTIPAETPIYVGYTLTDADGGETILNPDPVVVTTQGGLDSPTDAPDVELLHDAGTLVAGTYTYAITVTDGFGGETALGPTTSITVPPGNAASHIVISGLAALAADSSGNGYRLWRRVNGGAWGLTATGLADEVDDDGTLCVDCTVAPPLRTGRTNATNKLLVTVPAVAPNTDATSFSIYASTDGTFGNPSLLGTYPIADLGQEKTYTSLTYAEGSPPEASLTLPGASLIDARSQITFMPIGQPVANAAALPAAGTIDGELRITLDDNALHVWDQTGGSWTLVTAGGGGGGGTAGALVWRGEWASNIPYAIGDLVRHTGDDGITRLWAAVDASQNVEPAVADTGGGGAAPDVAFRDGVAHPVVIGEQSQEYKLLDSGWQTNLRLSVEKEYAYAFYFDVTAAGTVTIDFAPGPTQPVPNQSDMVAKLFKDPNTAFQQEIASGDDEHGDGYPLIAANLAVGRYYVLLGGYNAASAPPNATWFTYTITPGTATLTVLMPDAGGPPPWDLLSVGGGGGAHSRTTIDLATAALAVDQAVTYDAAMAKGYRLLKLTATSHCRVRLYTTAQARTNDAGRTSDVSPAGTAHGLVLDAELTGAEPIHFTPAIEGWNGDDPVAETVYVAVTAMEAGDSTVTFTYVKTED